MCNPSEVFTILSRALTISNDSIVAGVIVTGDTDTTNLSGIIAKLSIASTEVPLCVTLSSTSAADTDITVMTHGVALLTVDGSGTAIAINTRIVAGAGGIGFAAAAASATVQHVLGTAEEPSVAAGDQILVKLESFEIQNA